MKKVYFILTAIFVAILLVSCNQQKQTNETVPQMLNVDLTVLPEKGKINQPITFEAKVTQGKETVTDADEVTFEIWRSQAKKHEKIDIKKTTKGIYQLKRAFHQEGTYYVISHVTARGMHTMPKKEFVIGKPSKPETADSSMNMEENSQNQQQKK